MHYILYRWKKKITKINFSFKFPNQSNVLTPSILCRISLLIVFQESCKWIHFWICVHQERFAAKWRRRLIMYLTSRDHLYYYSSLLYPKNHNEKLNNLFKKILSVRFSNLSIVLKRIVRTYIPQHKEYIMMEPCFFDCHIPKQKFEVLSVKQF